MIKIIKDKKIKLQESNIISKWTQVILDAYDDGEIQPELKRALPLFIHNVSNTEIVDHIHTDVVGTPGFNNTLIYFSDTFDEIQLVSILINAFSKLNTSNKNIDTSSGSIFSAIINNKKSVLRAEDIKFEYTFDVDDIEILQFMTDELISDVCNEISNFLQRLIDTYNTLIFYNATIIKTYTEDMKPKLHIIFRVSVQDKVLNKEDVVENTEEDAEEDFMEEFNRRNNINRQTSVDMQYSAEEQIDETEYLLSSTENEKRLNRAIEELGSTVKTIQEQSDNIGFIGYYEIGGPEGLQINVKERPNWFQQKMLKLFFNIKWYERS